MTVMDGQLHLLLGPFGAGKSTFARTLSANLRAVLLILDDWMVRLYGADERPATCRVAGYVEQRDRCLSRSGRATSAASA